MQSRASRSSRSRRRRPPSGRSPTCADRRAGRGRRAGPRSVPLWFHTFALAPGVYTPGIARDHGYRLPVLGADRFAGRSVLDIGAFDGFYSFLAELRGARRVVAVDNEQYVDWVQARFGVTLAGGAGFRAIAGLVGSRVEYQRMDALDVRELGERFDVALCFGILHRVTDPIALLRALADVLTPGGEIVLETYGSHLPPTPRRSRFTSLATCTRATTSSTGASPRRVCGGWDASPASTRSKSSTSQRSTATRGSSQCCEPRADRASDLVLRPPLRLQRRRRRAGGARGPDAVWVAPRRWAVGWRPPGLLDCAHTRRSWGSMASARVSQASLRSPRVAVWVNRSAAGRAVREHAARLGGGLSRCPRPAMSPRNS